MRNYLRVIYVLTQARNKEFYRDRGVMIWAILFPFLIVGAIGFAFSGGGQTVFKVAIYRPAGSAVPEIPLHRTRLLAPVPRPGKILAIGLNYADHIAESGQERPERQLWFAKVSSSANGPTHSSQVFACIGGLYSTKSP